MPFGVLSPRHRLQHRQFPPIPLSALPSISMSSVRNAASTLKARWKVSKGSFNEMLTVFPDDPEAQSDLCTVQKGEAALRQAMEGFLTRWLLTTAFVMVPTCLLLVNLRINLTSSNHKRKWLICKGPASGHLL